MTIAALLITDGRATCFDRTVRSWRADCVGFDEMPKVVVCDSDKGGYRDFVRDIVPEAMHVFPINEKLGFDGAIRAGWQALKTINPDFVLHLEDDFTLNRPFDPLEAMSLLDGHPHIQQVALLRQPVNDAEAKAGGVINMWPNEYDDFKSGDVQWVEHRLFWTTNPSVYPFDLTKLGWPHAPGSEAKFTDIVLEDPDFKVAYLGSRWQKPWVHHIGEYRVGTGY